MHRIEKTLISDDRYNERNIRVGYLRSTYYLLEPHLQLFIGEQRCRDLAQKIVVLG